MRIQAIKWLLGICVIYYLTPTTIAQTNNACLSKYQLIKVQESSLDAIRIMLNNKGWSFDGAKSNENYDYFDYTINYNVVSWENTTYNNSGHLILYNYPEKANIVIYQTNFNCFNSLLQSFKSIQGKTSVDQDKLITIFKLNNTTIEFREYKNDYSSRQYSILLYNTKALNNEIRYQKELEEENIRAEAARKASYNNALAEGDILFANNQFTEAKMKYLTAKQIESSVFVQVKIDLCDKAICDKLIAKGDSLYNIGNYDEAIVIFYNAQDCSKSSSSLIDKISITEQLIRDKKINEFQLKAEKHIKEKNYNLAIDQYYNILQIDKSNMMAQEKIKYLQDLQNILEKRSTTIFSYKTTNNDDFQGFKKYLFDDLNNNINRNAYGFLNLTYLVAFDTNGTNLSTIKSLKSSLNGYATNLSTISKNGLLKPASESGYFLAATENLSLDVKWSTLKVKYKSTANGIFNSDFVNPDKNIISAFIKKQNFKYGKYIFEIKQKESSGSNYYDIHLVKYKTAGPEAAFYSMLFPGMGTLKVTYGEKGWGRFTLFLLSSGVAIYSKLHSNDQYKKYLNATSQEDIDKYYNSANLSQKLALVFGGLSASIYIYDIIWVTARGAKNLKYSKSLKRQLKPGPIPIQKQPITQK